jgi:hypothetical protein
VVLAGLLIHGSKREDPQVYLSMAAGAPDLRYDPADLQTPALFQGRTGSGLNSLPANSEALGESSVRDWTEHTIVKGDTLSRIARDNNLPLDALLIANPDVNPLNLQLGQRIRIPAPAAPGSDTPTE